ncbi:MAG: aromatic amino acid lyase, partial [Planctomycetota bacterium]|nr:aromatic amino acid lyase [Planctomycetota bacterium]
VVPQQGSVGGSGDLAPLAHLTAAYLGEGQATVGGKTLPAGEALARVGLAPIQLAAKEGLALINGTECMKAFGVVNVWRATNLSKAADAVAALTVEALFGSSRPFQALLADLKDNDGHRRTSANLRACLVESDVLASHTDCDRVQDPYSLRCVPQIHGAFKTALAHVRGVLSSELNAVTDNPLVVPETGEVFSAGMFHGQPLSMTQDYLCLATCTIANVSERRVEQLVNPDLSRLPAFLTPRPGLHSGLMIAQYTAASLASENKGLAHPASVDTVPTSANQEDHVSMGVTAARRAAEVLTNTEQVVAIELVCAAQAREFHTDLAAGKGAAAAREALRARVPRLDEDRYLHPDLIAAKDLLASGELVAAVEVATGPLAW